MAFDGRPDLYSQAHEAARGVQQMALRNNLQLKKGIGEVEDGYEFNSNPLLKVEYFYGYFDLKLPALV